MKWSREDAQESLNSTSHSPVYPASSSHICQDATFDFTFNIVMPRKLKSHMSVLFLTSDGDSRELHIIYNLDTGCMLSRAFFTLFTHDCVPIHSLIPL